jgi:tetratricopeptide (TPR) repeat protein
MSFRVLLVAAATVAIAPAATAQSYAELLARGDSLRAALVPLGALEAYRAAIRLQPTADVLWRFSRCEVDIAKGLIGDALRDQRDSLYGVAREYAEAAVRADSTNAEGWFMIANALGRLSRTRGGKERVRFARQIYDDAARALALDPNNDGAEHVLGAWHAEIMRLSGITKFFARTLMGADFMSRASWDSAVAHLERAVALKPSYLYHRLELAEVYVDVNRRDDARKEFEEVLRLPPTSDVSDNLYQAEAAERLKKLGPGR